MKKSFFVYVTVLSTVLFSTFTSCKKNDASADLSSTDATTQTEDQGRFSSEDDAISMEASNAFESYLSLSGREEGIQQLPCDATVSFDTLSSVRSITFTYNGSNCNGPRQRIRTGKVTISLPLNTRWRTAGAQLTVKIDSLKITRVADNKSITINGTKYITNVTGGLLKNLPFAPAGTSITHAITSPGMNVTFDNGTTRSWQIAKNRKFTYGNGGFIINVTGTHTEGSINNISEWGLNRFGNAFSIQIIDPLTIRESCQWRLTSGKLIHTRIALPITVTYGLDSSGNPTTCPAIGSNFYFKAEWTNLQNQPKSIILPYN